MCAGALHRFNNGIPVGSDTQAPAPGTQLYNELWNRQKRTLGGDVLPTMVDRTWAPDTGHATDVHSMKYHTQKDWEEKLRPRLDAGKPTILVLMVTEKDGNLNLTDNHQVVAMGYRYDRSSSRLGIWMYDPNDPGQLHLLSMVFSGEFINAEDETTGKRYRGFFVNSQTDPASA
jgi:hypothetical protein